MKSYAVNNPEILQEDFYRSYDLKYWLSKINLLKNCHDHYSEVREVLRRGEEENELNDDNFRRMLRTEMHFLYFQMTECLFEHIYAMCDHDYKYLWAVLSLSNTKDSPFKLNTYQRIRALNEKKENIFKEKMRYWTHDGKIHDVPLLQWLFYFSYPTKLSEVEMEQNLLNIEKLLKVFAKDFGDREDYNAYKHGLRCFNSRFRMGIGREGSETMHVLTDAQDSIYYLEEDIGDDIKCPIKPRIRRVVKTFDFERDWRCCVLIESLIHNLISSRKHVVLEELRDVPFNYTRYDAIHFPEVVQPSTGNSRFKMTL